MEIKMVCSECGKEPESDKEKSNENWEAYYSDCKYCGGLLKPQVE